MANIVIGAPITIWKGILMERTWIIHPTNMMNGINKIRGRENPTKREGFIEQGMEINQL